MATGSGCLGLIKSVVRFTAIAMVLGAIALGVSYVLWMFMLSTDEVRVPNVINKPEGQAVIDLNNAGLVVGDIRGRYNEDFLAGRIIGQDPQPGRLVKEGRRVNLQKSLGSQMVAVPDVRGLSVSDAEMEANRSGLVPKVQTRTWHDTVPEGHIITTSPPPESLIVRSGDLGLLISLGPRPEAWVMPDVRDMDLREASHGFQSMGVEVQVLRVDAESMLQDNRILEQQPPPGSRVESGERVSLKVATAAGAPSRSALRLFDTQLPAEALRLPVRIEISDENGTRTVFEVPRLSDLKFRDWFWMVGVAEVRVYVNDELVDQQVFTPPEEAEAF